jgi:hypothetical protein
LAENVRIGTRGEVELRTGYTQHDSNLVAEVAFLYPWRTGAGVDHMIVVDNAGDVWEDSLDGTFTDSTKNTNPATTLEDLGVGFAGAEGSVYITSKTITSDPIAFDGTTWSNVTGFPKAKTLVYRHGRMFAMNTSTRPTGILFSNYLDVETFDAADYIEVDPNDGYQINAAAAFGDDLVVFKDKALWKLSGRTPSSFALYQVDSLRGSVAPRGLCELRARLFFIDRDTGIWAFDGAEMERVSEPINEYFLMNQDYDNAHKASAYAIGNRAYFSIPWTGATNRMLVWNADTEAWTEYDGGFNDSIFYLNDRYLGLPGATGLYKADSASKLHPPSVSDINGTVRTAWLRLGGPGAKARVRRIEALVDALDGQTVTVNMYRDFDPTTVYATRNFTGGPAFAGSATDQRVVALDDL